jgi:hypothetical protein
MISGGKPMIFGIYFRAFSVKSFVTVEHFDPQGLSPAP